MDVHFVSLYYYGQEAKVSIAALSMDTTCLPRKYAEHVTDKMRDRVLWPLSCKEHVLILWLMMSFTEAFH